MIRTAAIILAALAACSAPTDSLRYSACSRDGQCLTLGVEPGSGTCEPLAGQWELTSYDARPDSSSPGGFALAGRVDAAAVDAVADAVEGCLAGFDAEPIAEARCAWPRGAWQLERGCTTVLAAPGEESCTMPGRYVLASSDAAGSCEDWGKPDVGEERGEACPCRWTVATQDGGRTVAVPEQEPTNAAEAFVRLATGCAWPWLDPGLAACIQAGRSAW